MDEYEFRNIVFQLKQQGVTVIGADSQLTEKTMKLVGKSKNILFGTQAIFSEGISLDALSCLVLGTPVNNEPLLTQLIGRIIRKLPNKKQPTVVDIHLKGKPISHDISSEKLTDISTETD